MCASPKLELHHRQSTTAGGLVVGAAYLLITRTTDAVVENHEDEEISAARLSVLAVENALFMAKNKDTREWQAGKLQIPWH